jgi:lysosomal acid lipase/cholesteryl ester hydrolase
MNDENRSPAFMLVNAGFDVWLGNSRGNKNSREHQWLDPDDNQDKYKFFDFSFEEMAKYDTPAIIHYILNYTKQKNLTVIGHSQGATTMLIKMSEDIDWWNQHVNIFI